MQQIIVAALLLLSGFATSMPQDKETIGDKRRVDSAFIESKTQELRCRGGSLMFKRLSERTTSSGNVVVGMSVSFVALTDRAAGADSSGLSEGRCGWVDRPMTMGDNRILFETLANAQWRKLGEQVDTSATAAERYPDAQSIPQYLRDPNHFWSFFGAFNGPLNYFSVSRHQAWTKPYEMKRRNMDIFRKP